MTNRQIESIDVIVFIVAGILVILLMFGFILYFLISYKSKKRDYNLLEIQKKELDDQKKLLENTLSELRATQSQLIHSEKMASLGQLTAGIAHEIQNPLNFVNNFSDVSKELLTEMREDIKKNNIEDALELASDVVNNLDKIYFHGKKAESIVKGMLQHSRAAKGLLEKADINLLCDESIRLAYHGMKSKFMDFNVEITTIFAQNIPKIYIIPQDIGRVILNILSNAFYATIQKSKKISSDYKPNVTIKTLYDSSGVNVYIRDNGCGIPQEIKDKIFQPFFTTKISGQGTGLGLSICYDIINSHGGRISFESKEREFTEFNIFLPNKSNLVVKIPNNVV
ncbi:MAG TPA: ATP-binding protein [Saprospiraceae bacterium]|nr:GHKL domain-containing protein [Saprospiraceae bacterium]HRO08210.1 ATP-binding protein [Saprospiraceae bacterium]HRO72389.1 ATP-binding protein [Saprospiraceae bacterium]HRP41101.1 ATP-binding protein [Saprospiraceae bacterium]